VELGPGVFYAPASGARDHTSKKNELEGWKCYFEGFVPPPFGRVFDPGLQYVQIQVTAPFSALYQQTSSNPLIPSWVQFTLPSSAFPPDFVRDDPFMRNNGFKCVFPLPPVFSSERRSARFVTPVDLRKLIDDYETCRCLRTCCFLCPCGINGFLGGQNIRYGPRSDYGLGPPPERARIIAPGGGCGAACGYGGGYAGGAGGGCGGGGCGGGCGGRGGGGWGGGCGGGGGGGGGGGSGCGGG
jgi:hypothetical protein